MSKTQARCPHCGAVQEIASYALCRCSGCEASFYPAPATDAGATTADPTAAAATERKREARRFLRTRAEGEAEQSVFRLQACVIFGVLLLLVCALQLGFGTVFYTLRDGNAVLILRQEEPQTYWSWVALTFTLGAGLLGVGLYAQRRIRATLDRRFPQDERA